MGNFLSALKATTAPTRVERDSAGGTGDTTGVTVTGADVKTAASVVSSVDDEDAPETDSEDPYIDQCGLDPDPEGLWEDAEPEPRIKESRLTEEEKAKYRGLLKELFSVDAIKGKRLQFDPYLLVEICDKVIPYLNSESMLIEDVPFDITIVADLHGQLYDLERVFRGEEKNGKPGWENMKFLFLGNYVDRGRQSLEIVLALFCLKMLYPDRIFLLRGNHEFVHTNCRNGFLLDFLDRYAEATALHLYFKVNEAFCFLSSAAIVGNSYFCAHAGISPAAFTRRHLHSVRKPILDTRDDVMIHDCCWSDIAKGLKGTVFNGSSQTGHFYGLDELALALHNMDCIGMFRGHSVLENGFEVIENLCISLYTATGTSKFNHAAVAIVNPQGKIEFRVFACSPERVASVNMLKQWDAKHCGGGVVRGGGGDTTTCGDGQIATIQE